MSDNVLNRPESETGVDFQAIEAEIDKEIDSLFVPMQKAPAPASQALAVEAGPAEISAPDNTPAPHAKAAPRLDLDSLQVEIDREIDNLFVPFTRKTQDTAADTPVAASETERFETVEHAPPAPPPLFAPPEEEQAAAREADDQFPALSIEYEEYPSSEDLPKLVEVFNAAYLSFDWEVSPQNISKLQNALKGLEPFATRYSSTTSIFKILQVILSRLYTRPQSASSRICELVRDSQGLLAHILLISGETGATEKERLDDILARFRGMREKALAAKHEVKAPKIAPAAPIQPPAAKIEVAPTVAETAPEPPGQGAPELSVLIRETSRTFEQTLAGIEAEIARMKQIEAVLRKSAALGPVADRLEGIRTGLEQQARSLREREVQWGENAAKLIVQAPSPEPAVEKTPVRDTQTRQEDVCILSVAGKQLALPAPSIVKATPVSGRKISGIIKRGHAVLADTRPLFRSIKSGVIGKWTEMSAKVLGSYRFALLNERASTEALPLPDRGVAVFASNGDSHGIFLVESAEFVSAAVSTSPDGRDSIVEAQGSSVPLIDPNRLLAGVAVS